MQPAQAACAELVQTGCDRAQRPHSQRAQRLQAQPGRDPLISSNIFFGSGSEPEDPDAPGGLPGAESPSDSDEEGAEERDEEEEEELPADREGKGAEGGAGAAAVEADAVVDVDPASLLDVLAATGAEPLESAERQRKGRLILELVNAGASLEQRIAQHRADIDEELLEMLGMRILMQRQLQDLAGARDEGQLRALFTLLKRLSAEYERERASPAERLLDECLRLMAPRPDSDFRDRQQAVATRLTDAFHGGGGGGVDIFGLAASLAEGAQAAVAEEVEAGAVAAEALLREGYALLAEAREEQQRLAQAARDTEDPALRARARAAMQDKALAMSDLQEVLNIARAVM